MNRAVFGKGEIPTATKIEALKRTDELAEGRQKLSTERENLFYQNCIDLADPILD